MFLCSQATRQSIHHNYCENETKHIYWVRKSTARKQLPARTTPYIKKNKKDISKIASYMVRQARSRQVRGPMITPPALHQNCSHGGSTPRRLGRRLGCRSGRGPSSLAIIFGLATKESACRYTWKTYKMYTKENKREGRDHTNTSSGNMARGKALM